MCPLSGVSCLRRLWGDHLWGCVSQPDSGTALFQLIEFLSKCSIFLLFNEQFIIFIPLFFFCSVHSYWTKLSCFAPIFLVCLFYYMHFSCGVACALQTAASKGKWCERDEKDLKEEESDCPGERPFSTRGVSTRACSWPGLQRWPSPRGLINLFINPHPLYN